MSKSERLLILHKAEDEIESDTISLGTTFRPDSGGCPTKIDNFVAKLIEVGLNNSTDQSVKELDSVRELHMELCVNIVLQDAVKEMIEEEN